VASSTDRRAFGKAAASYAGTSYQTAADSRLAQLEQGVAMTVRPDPGWASGVRTTFQEHRQVPPLLLIRLRWRFVLGADPLNRPSPPQRLCLAAEGGAAARREALGDLDGPVESEEWTPAPSNAQGWGMLLWPEDATPPRATHASMTNSVVRMQPHHVSDSHKSHTVCSRSCHQLQKSCAAGRRNPPNSTAVCV
jgi:hypothetical protein